VSLSGFPGFSVGVRCFALLFFVLGLPACSVTSATAESRTQSGTTSNNHLAGHREGRVFTGNLKVLTLNVAHGRKDGFNQLFQSDERIRNNLKEVAAFLNQTEADIVALQEADGPSRWSGNIDHVELLAQQAGYPRYSRAGHAKSWLFDYGTALLIRGDFTETSSYAFAPSPPTLSKGFLIGQIVWQSKNPSDPPVLVDVVSVHLDFSRSSIRQQQIVEMLNILAERKNPIIILGDFNSDWFNDASVVQDLARRCRLHTYKPLANDLGTYRKSERRLDWILISSELEFKHYSVLPDIVSDHYAVVAEVAFRNKQNINENDNKTHLTCK
jgi:endonuclease/exonuclease/phosphatase family metal-dependent hydrolase